MSQTVVRAMPVEELSAERARLVRLCARLTGDAAVAEDLAQETLFEAWRSADSLRDVRLRQAWLSGIARNVCRRWARAHGQESARIGYVREETDTAPTDMLADTFDLELELERDELATLLDRALALLPAETRMALVQRYIEDAPQALIAERLGLSEGAVAMRLSRGKLSLRRILAGELRDDAVALEVFGRETSTWEPTRIWCPICGEQRLIGWFDRMVGTLMLRCPGCFPAHGLYQVRSRHQPYIYAGVHSLKAAYRRMLVFCDDYYQRALAEDRAICHTCGGAATVHPFLPECELPRIRGWRGAHIYCAICNESVHASLDGLMLSLPTVRTFWQQEGRIRTLPEREIEVDGRAAIVTRFESCSSSATIDLVSDTATLAPRRAYANGHLLTSP